MPFNSFLPKNDFLKKYVAYYYTDGSDEEAYRSSYLFYPHVYTTLSFYRHAVCRFEGNSSTISYDKNIKHLKIVTQQTLPRRSTQIGKTNKIAITFKPLGLNAFIKETYAEMVPDEAQIFNPGNSSQWDDMLDRLFEQNNNEKIIEILDEFLLRQFNNYENPVLEETVSILSDVNNNLSFDEIAKMINVSRKTILRYFKSELRMTPELFRMIVRFRFAINEKILKDSKDTLTRIAYEANFFDQAYFIKRFRQLTGVTPTQFFKKGTRIGKEDTFWTFDAKNF